MNAETVRQRKLRPLPTTKETKTVRVFKRQQIDFDRRLEMKNIRIGFPELNNELVRTTPTTFFRPADEPADFHLEFFTGLVPR
ncbi:MAG TPA: hypothetical protein VGJ15_05740 [Pirellulales bacterium]